jgi:glucosamine-6-phosphate deaminase
VNDLQIDLRSAHFWGMDEWYVDGKEVAPTHPLSFAKADMELCFNRIDKKFRMPDAHLHFPTVAGIEAFSRSFDEITCAVMQGGQGEVKHWAFNDPPARTGDYVDTPPTPEEYRKLGTRVVTLHPFTLI